MKIVPLNEKSCGFINSLRLSVKIIICMIIIFELQTIAAFGQTPNYLIKFIDTVNYGKSQVYDNGSNVGFGIKTPRSKLHLHSDEIIVLEDEVIDDQNDLKSLPSVPINQSSALTAFQITNNVTDSLATDGLLMGVRDKNAFFSHQEKGNIIFSVNGHNAFTIMQDGKVGFKSKVGIGTNSPFTNLQVVGNSTFTETANSITSSAYIRGSNSFSTPTKPDYTWFNNDLTGIFHPGPDVIAFTVGGAETMRIDKAAVGIGTNAPHPNYKLSVNGKIRAKEIIVETNWSDFVFEKDYNLMSLSDVENYINEYGHLTGVPSAIEVEKNGVALGNSQAVLLQKIEELTLYTIEMNKQMELLRAQNLELQNKMNELLNQK